jgi:hypothetical protein
MKSKNVTSMTVIGPSERRALLKLVQRASEVMMAEWIEDCMVSFGWTQETAILVVQGLRRMAKRELAREETD